MIPARNVRYFSSAFSNALLNSSNIMILGFSPLYSYCNIDIPLFVDTDILLRPKRFPLSDVNTAGMFLLCIHAAFL